MAGCIENHVQLMASVRNIMYGGLYRESRPVNGFSEEYYVRLAVLRITSSQWLQ